LGGNTVSNGGDIRYTVKNEKMCVVQVPADPIDKASASEKRIWEQRIDEYVKHDKEPSRSKLRNGILVDDGGARIIYMRAI
jgi:predicted phosphoribosyltransferase